MTKSYDWMIECAEEMERTFKMSLNTAMTIIQMSNIVDGSNWGAWFTDLRRAFEARNTEGGFEE